jgi:epoxyqueuosine reductase
LERDFASASGLGWNGKSTMQIHPELGTWFLLSVVLTTLELPPDPPYPDRCGTCTRCLDACPTRAITSPHRLDARLCISYLTIEHRGDIPEPLRPAVGGRVFGCDDCLEACPWNRFAQAGRDATFHAREHLSRFTLTDYLDLGEDEFNALFRHSPVRRTGWARFLRNVCVALGNTGDHRDLPALRDAARHPEPVVARHAAWAAGAIGGRPPAAERTAS